MTSAAMPSNPAATTSPAAAVACGLAPSPRRAAPSAVPARCVPRVPSERGRRRGPHATAADEDARRVASAPTPVTTATPLGRRCSPRSSAARLGRGRWRPGGPAARARPSDTARRRATHAGARPRERARSARPAAPCRGACRRARCRARPRSMPVDGSMPMTSKSARARAPRAAATAKQGLDEAPEEAGVDGDEPRCRPRAARPSPSSGHGATTGWRRCAGHRPGRRPGRRAQPVGADPAAAVGSTRSAGPPPSEPPAAPRQRCEAASGSPARPDSRRRGCAPVVSCPSTPVTSTHVPAASAVGLDRRSSDPSRP